MTAPTEAGGRPRRVLEIAIAVCFGFVFLLFGPSLNSLFYAAGVTMGGLMVVRYVSVLAGVMVSRPAGPSAPAPHEEPAYRQYLFGPAVRDLRAALIAAVIRYRRDVERIWGGIGPAADRGLTGLAVAIGLSTLLIVGVVVGVAVLAGVMLVHVAVVGALLGVGMAAVYALRAGEAGLAWIRGIRVACPSCYRRVSVPVYDCPHCGAAHRRALPGRYGVAHRVCRCGARIPVLAGRRRLAGRCPYCEMPMVRAAGTAPEVVVPVFGAPAAGKTRLLATLVLGLTTRPGLGVELDPDTAGRYERIRPALLLGEPTRATLAELPRAYSMYLRAGRAPRRLVHFFDAAGERYGRSDRLGELSYLRLSRSFVFVLDVLSIGGVWAGLAEADRERLAPYRAALAPEFVFAQLTTNVQGMGVPLGRARLAVAVSKVDLVPGAVAGLPPAGDQIGAWLEGPAGQGNLVRAMRLHFGQVRFFLTSSLVGPAGLGPGASMLVDWVLEQRGGGEPR